MRVVLEDLLAAGVDADVDRVEPGLDHAAGDLLGDQRAVADHPDFLDALLLRVADLLGQVPVEERLAVVVHAHVRDAELGALVDDLRNSSTLMTPWRRCISSRGQNTHFALQMFVLSIWTISGRIGERSRPVASSSRRIGFAWRRSIDSAARRARGFDLHGSVC